MKTRSSFLLLHLIVFIWGFSAILGKLIQAEALHLVWYRMIIAVCGIYIFMLYKRISLKIDFPAFLKFLGVGAIIAAHWFFFYHAIDVSNVAVTLTFFSAGTLFTALIEPLLNWRKIRLYEVLFGIAVIFTIAKIFSLDTGYEQGMYLSLAAALGSSLFSVLNGMLVKKYNSSVISFYELLLGFLILSVYLLVTGEFKESFFRLPAMDVVYISILALVCTSFTFVVSVEVMKEISPYTVTLTVNLEVVYGIILAYLIFPESEEMSFGFYFGAAVLLALVFSNAIIKRYAR